MYLGSASFFTENGFSMFLWLGYNLSPEFIQDVFGVNSLAQINIESGLLLELDNPRSQRINGIVKTLRSQRNRFMKVSIFIQTLFLRISTSNSLAVIQLRKILAR